MPSSPTEFMLCARWVIPVVPHATCYEDHAVIVSDGRIVDILPRTAAASQFPDIDVISLENHIVTPGLVNAHGHAAMSLLRGYADDIELMEWLQQHIWPVEGKFVDADFCYDGTALAIAEMIRTGTTCGVDTYFFPDATARAYIDNHFRAQVCLPVVQFGNAWASSEENHVHKALEVHDRVRSEALITTAFAPHAPYTVTDEGFRQIRMYADQLDIPIHLHLHETVSEIETAIAESGQRPFERVASLGLMTAQLQTVHMTQLTDNEITQLATNGVHVVHCPESNLKLASGFCPVDKLVKAGVNVCIGTDGAASNNNLDMLEEMRTAAILSKAVAQDATSIGADDALAMATINGARMLGLEDEIGSIEPGKSADLIAVDMSALNFQPMHHPVSQLVYAATGHQVSDVWIGGRQLLKCGEFTELDEAGLRSRVQNWSEKIHG